MCGGGGMGESAGTEADEPSEVWDPDPPEDPGAWTRFVTVEARVWDRWTGWTRHLALWQVVLLVGLPLLAHDLAAPMQSQHEPVDAGRHLVQIDHLLDDPFRTCVQPAWADALWPGGYHPIYCGIYWSGELGPQVVAIPAVLLMGSDPMSLRILAIAITLATAWVIGWTAGRVWTPGAGRLTAALWLSSPIVAYYGWHYHGILWCVLLVLALAEAVRRALHGGRRWPVVAVLAIGLQMGQMFVLGALVVAIALAATRRSAGGWYWRPAALMAAVVVAWQAVPIAIAHWVYDDRRSSYDSAQMRRTTVERLLDGENWQAIWGHLMFVGTVSTLALLTVGAVTLVRWRRGLAWRAGVQWTPRGHLLIIAAACLSMTLGWAVVFLQAVVVHEWFWYGLSIPAVLSVVHLMGHERVRPLRMPALVLLLMLNGTHLTHKWDDPGRPWSVGWQTWMAAQTDEDDRILVHRDLVDLDSAVVWASPADFVIFTDGASQQELLAAVDGHHGVTMLIIPWSDEQRLDLRPEMESRGWTREVHRLYMGGTFSWIIWHETSPLA